MCPRRGCGKACQSQGIVGDYIISYQDHGPRFLVKLWYTVHQMKLKMVLVTISASTACWVVLAGLCSELS